MIQPSDNDAKQLRDMLPTFDNCGMWQYRLKPDNGITFYNTLIHGSSRLDGRAFTDFRIVFRPYGDPAVQVLIQYQCQSSVIRQQIHDMLTPVLRLIDEYWQRMIQEA